MEFKKELKIKLDSCPHCGDYVAIECKSILGEKILIDQFYKYYKWHLKNECFEKHVKKIKSLSLTEYKGSYVIYTKIKLVL